VATTLVFETHSVHDWQRTGRGDRMQPGELSDTGRSQAAVDSQSAAWPSKPSILLNVNIVPSRLQRAEIPR
jgi:hypothetical protein